MMTEWADELSNVHYIQSDTPNDIESRLPISPWMQSIEARPGRIVKDGVAVSLYLVESFHSFANLYGCRKDNCKM